MYSFISVVDCTLLCQNGISATGYSLLEAFIEFRRPAVVLGLGGKFPLFVTEVRANDVDFHKGPEALCPPLQLISSHHWMIKAGKVQLKMKMKCDDGAV